jgi:glycosyltransferase involved in cell wall biosynthesis
MPESTDDPLVSVVIPTYNRASLIAESLDSVFAQTYPRLEVIVIDDGSTDGTENAVAPYLDRIIYVRQKNQGLAGARNAGFAKASGEYIAWLDSDDLWNPEKTALQLAYLRKRPDTVCIASDFSAFSSDGFFDRSHVRGYYLSIKQYARGLDDMFSDVEMLSTRGVPYVGEDVPEAVRVYSGNIYDTLVRGNCLHPPTVMFRRDAAMQIGPLNGAFRGAVDYEYLVRLSRVGRCAFMDHPLMRYRYSANQMSSEANWAADARSLLLILQDIRSRDPALFARPAFRHRLGYAHLAVARALAGSDQIHAAAHLLRSIGWGCFSRRTVTTAALVFTPGWAREIVRRSRRSASRT